MALDSQKRQHEFCTRDSLTRECMQICISAEHTGGASFVGKWRRRVGHLFSIVLSCGMACFGGMKHAQSLYGEEEE